MKRDVTVKIISITGMAKIFHRKLIDFAGKIIYHDKK